MKVKKNHRREDTSKIECGGGRVRKNDPRYRGEAGLMSRRSNIHVSVYNIWECRPRGNRKKCR